MIQSLRIWIGAWIDCRIGALLKNYRNLKKKNRQKNFLCKYLLKPTVKKQNK